MNKQGTLFSAWAAHLIDLKRLLRFQFANPYSYTKFRIIRSIARQTGARTMIETGTYLGNTASRCSRIFDRVYTIELDQSLAERAATFLQRKKNVTVIQGDGSMQVPRLLERSDVSDVLVFLDGHYSGGITAKGALPEPAADELHQMSRFKNKIRAIIIDDFRSFGAQEGFPAKSELFRSYEENFGDDFAATVHLDQVIIVRRQYHAIPG